MKPVLPLVMIFGYALSTVGGRITTGSFELPNARTGEPISFHYRVPLDRDDQPSATADRVVFYAPCFGEKKYFHEPRLIRYTEEFGYSLLTMDFPSNPEEIGLRDRYYIFPEAGYHEPILEAARELRRRFGLAPGKLLLFGISSGGSLVEQLAVHHPGEVLAAASAGGRFFDPVPPDFPVPLLLLNTFGCPNRPDTRAFAARWPATARYPLWCALTPPVFADKGNRFFHHTPSPCAYDLMAEFLHAVAELAAAHHGELPPADQWPVPPASAEAPGPYPAADFAALWQRLPHQALLRLENPDPRSPLTVLTPPEPPPDRIVFYLHDPQLDSATTLADNLYYLAHSGAVAASVVLDDDPEVSLRRIRSALDELEERAEWRHLPLYVAGSGLGGQLAAVAAQNRPGNRIRRIVTLNSEYRSVFRNFSIEANRRRNSRPLTMIFDDPELSLPEPTAPGVRLLRQSHPTPQFGDGLNWFETLRRLTSDER